MPSKRDRSSEVIMGASVTPEVRRSLKAAALLEHVAVQDLLGEIVQSWLIANAGDIVDKIEKTGLGSAGPFNEIKTDLEKFVPDQGEH